MSIAKLVQKIRPEASNHLAQIEPSFVFTQNVKSPAPISHEPPCTVGIRVHRLLSSSSKPSDQLDFHYLPWANALRRSFWQYGVWVESSEQFLDGLGKIPSGKCDHLMSGIDARLGLVEVKTLCAGQSDEVRHADLLQLGAYGRLVAGHNRRFESMWLGLAYIDLASKRTILRVYEEPRRLIMNSVAAFGAI